MNVTHTTVVGLGNGWTPNGWRLTLACGHVTDGVAHMQFQLGDTMVCANEHDESEATPTAGDRVRIVDGFHKGKCATVREVGPYDEIGYDGEVAVVVLDEYAAPAARDDADGVPNAFLNHFALWQVKVIPLSEHERGCDCPKHVAETVAAVAADRVERGLSPDGTPLVTGPGVKWISGETRLGTLMLGDDWHAEHESREEATAYARDMRQRGYANYRAYGVVELPDDDEPAGVPAVVAPVPMPSDAARRLLAAAHGITPGELGLNAGDEP